MNNNNYTPSENIIDYPLWENINKSLILDTDNIQQFDEIFPIDKIENGVHWSAASGGGKTEGIKILCIRLVLKQDGSIVIFDPHGDLAQQLAKRMDNKKDIIYIDPSLENGITPTINPFRTKSDISIMSQEIFNALESIVGTDFTPNMEVLLMPCIYVLLKKGDSGIDELSRFMDDDRNEDLIALGLKSEIAIYREFFKYQFKKSKFDVTKNALETKIQLLLNNPIFYNFVTGKSTLDLAKALNTKGKIIIFRFPKNKMRKTLEPAAKLVMAAIQGIVFQRADIPIKALRPKTYLILDEFQNFTNSTLKEMLVESRKNHLSVVCSNQHLSQLDTQTRDAVLSSNIKIVGKNSIKDLKVMSEEIDVDLKSLKSLEKGEFYIKVGSNPAVRFRTTDKFIDNNHSISDKLWEKHLKYQKKHYYKNIIIDEVDTNPSITENSNVLPTPKFDID